MPGMSALAKAAGRMVMAAALTVMVFALMSPAFAAQEDVFDTYRAVIDDYRAYDIEERDRIISELQELSAPAVEKHYLLGMLNFIQALDSMNRIARGMPEKPVMSELVKDPAVRAYIERATNHYDSVEAAEPGYKFIYCKYAELFFYTFNEQGLKGVTRKVGQAEQNERTAQCKAAIDMIAEELATKYSLEVARTIYASAIETWDDYPVYMVEAVGDIEGVLGNMVEAKKWWKRCVDEAESDKRRKRCQGKMEEEVQGK